jgi:hypothetical protein
MLRFSMLTPTHAGFHETRNSHDPSHHSRKPLVIPAKAGIQRVTSGAKRRKKHPSS